MPMLETLQSLVGKTIKSVEDRACNSKTFTFTDGSVVELEAVNVAPSIGLIGIDAYLKENKEPKKVD